ncbi:hypothetical protein OH76DRAFT_1559523 [Lentinus brumalis]|uniref:N-acetyltransferase domain-containing protein n=1 Tax=Lentinus brumalis TaxID=2498619 RepID=A0A371CWP5_9APHY|nr:hypothetical protein OH76DRAFT_1559523 [Polyporus brumalis]
MYCGALSAQSSPISIRACQCALRPRIRLVALGGMSASDHNDEKAPLLGGGPVVAGDFLWHDEIEVKPLRYSNIPQATSSTYNATLVESMVRYFDDVDSTPLPASRRKLLIALGYADVVRRGRVLTINRGDSNLSYCVSGEKRAGPLVLWVHTLFNGFKSAELRKRETEIGTKLRAMFKSALGDRVNEMMELAGLATAPEKQGRGYATALVKALNDMADARGCAVFVITDDAKWFYEELGYVVVAEDWAGVDNPKWKGDPVPVRLMVREPRSTGGFVTVHDVEKGLMEVVCGGRRESA